MKYKLINENQQTLFTKRSAKEQILLNRGIKEEELNHYMNLTDADINPPEAFGEELMAAAAKCFLNNLKKDSVICIVVDCDCDGYTSSAILINYISDLTSPEWIEEHVHWFMHDGKQHGLSDCEDWLNNIAPNLVIIPDAGTNDAQQLYELENDNIDIIILDHHEIEEKDFWFTECHPHAFLINSQSPKYPNKDLSGAGVVWQFCRCVDKITNNNYADQYLDLVAIGLDGDMMSLQSFETRRLISKGLTPKNIINPFVYGMWQKNKFKLGDMPSAWGATFYIVPLVNAITRSGTLEEKELIFNSMLKFKAYQLIPSNKRGHKPGEEEPLIDQALRTCTNVKNRQTRAEDAGIELVKNLIEKDNMMEHKVLLFKLEPGQIKAEIRGLVANKLMARYQRPCCMLTKRTECNIDENTGEVITEHITYEGSARGCDKVGVTEFKDICARTNECNYTIGHQGAFGLGINEEAISAFIEKTDELLEDMPNEPIYYVDYIWRANEVDGQAILEIGEMDKYWGKDMDEALVAIRGLQITKEMITMMASNTLKITLPNGVNIIKFRCSNEEYNKLYSETGYVEIDAVFTCNVNEWNDNKYPQLFLKDFDIKGGCAYVF